MLDFKQMILETEVNGETRQKQNTSELIYDIPTLIETCSMGITLQPGDVIATGTPFGTGMSKNVNLKSGDKIEVSVTSLGMLSNTVGDSNSLLPVHAWSGVAVWSADANLSRSVLVSYTSRSPGKQESDAPTIIFVFGLGGSSANYAPLIASPA